MNGKSSVPKVTIVGAHGKVTKLLGRKEHNRNLHKDEKIRRLLTQRHENTHNRIHKKIN